LIEAEAHRLRAAEIELVDRPLTSKEWCLENTLAWATFLSPRELKVRPRAIRLFKFLDQICVWFNTIAKSR
jgi:hypothetical protein